MLVNSALLLVSMKITLRTLFVCVYRLATSPTTLYVKINDGLSKEILLLQHNMCVAADVIFLTDLKNQLFFKCQKQWIIASVHNHFDL